MHGLIHHVLLTFSSTSWVLSLPGYVPWVENLHLNSSSELLSAYLIMCSQKSEQFRSLWSFVQPHSSAWVYTPTNSIKHRWSRTHAPLKEHPSRIYLFRYAYLWWPSFSDVFKVSVNICFEGHFFRAFWVKTSLSHFYRWLSKGWLFTNWCWKDWH